MSDLIQPSGQHQSRRIAVTQYAIPQSRALTKFQRCGGPAPIYLRRAGGFSLIEVLVAVLVVSVGLLGLAALQITGLRLTESAQLRTRVTMAAYDAIDRLRTDPSSLLSNGARKVPADTCSNPIKEDGALGRWYEDFCAFGLPPPVEKENESVVTIDCKEGSCGAGNCEIVIYWDDARGGKAVRNEDEIDYTSGDKSFWICTRLPM